MSKEKECESCKEIWYDSDLKYGLCPNCYDYFKQLKQQLEEKNKEINEMLLTHIDNDSYYETINDYERELAEKRQRD